MERMSSAARARALLQGGFFQSAIVYDGLSARAAESCGYDSLYMSGFGVAASQGFPDVGLTTFSEMLQALRAITRSVSTPVFADADTGFGNAVNVQRTVREYEATGAAGLHLEDQEFPKKCGFMQGKRVIDAAEHSRKIRAACEARRDPNFIIIGRTDALAPHGWDEVVRRAHAYRDAGADLIMVDGVRKPDAPAYIERLVRAGLPCIFNGELHLSSEEAAQAGFKFQIVGAGFLGAYNGMYRALAAARRGGRQPPAEVPVVTDILGLPEIYEIEAKYAGREMPSSTAFKV